MSAGIATLIGLALVIFGLAEAVVTWNVTGLTVLLCGAGLIILATTARWEPRA